MTIEEKQHKIKLIYLILIVEIECFRRVKDKKPIDLIDFAVNHIQWMKELHRVNRIIPFKK